MLTSGQRLNWNIARSQGVLLACCCVLCVVRFMCMCRVMQSKHQQRLSTQRLRLRLRLRVIQKVVVFHVIFCQLIRCIVQQDCNCSVCHGLCALCLRSVFCSSIFVCNWLCVFALFLMNACVWS